MSDRPTPGEHDEAKLLGEMQRLVDDWRAGLARGEDAGIAWQRAYLAGLERDLERDDGQGNLAALLLSWITGGWLDAEAADSAYEVLNGSSTDARTREVREIVHRIAASEITWNELAAIEKTPLVPRSLPKREALPADAIPLTHARETLEAMLADDGFDLDRPDATTAWSAFKAFAARPVAAAAPFVLDHDMCFFQAGVHDWGDGRNFEWGFTRQFSIDNEHGVYDHMERIELTLLYDPEDPVLKAMAEDGAASGPDLAEWVREVEALDVFAVPATKALPRGMRLSHEEV